MEKQDFVDQRQRAIDRFLEEHAAGRARQGTIVATFRQRSGRRLGPYFKLTYRAENRRQVAVYLGPEGPLVAATCRQLAQLQEPHSRQRRWKQMRLAVHAEMKRARRQLAELLAQQGLVAKGAEIRGWTSLKVI